MTVTSSDEPQEVGDWTGFEIDFGSAPIDALFDLLERCHAAGATVLSLGS